VRHAAVSIKNHWKLNLLDVRYIHAAIAFNKCLGNSKLKLREPILLLVILTDQTKEILNWLSIEKDEKIYVYCRRML